MRLNGRKLLAAMGLTSALVLTSIVAMGAGPASKDKDTVTGVTEPQPSMEGYNLYFQFLGVVKKVDVVEGQAVKFGDLLMEQDDAIDLAELERLKNEADSDAKQQFYEAARDFKKLTYDQKNEANKKGSNVWSFFDIEQAKADWIQAEKQILVNDVEHKGDIIKARQQELKIDRMKLRSPVDGVVKQIKIHEGELATPDQAKVAIIIVQNDPCYVRVDNWEGKVTSAQVSRLKEGDMLDVQYPGEPEWRQAKIVYIDPVAKSSGDIHTVRALLPNPDKRPTGVWITVKLPAKLLGDAPVSAAGQR